MSKFVLLKYCTTNFRSLRRSSTPISNIPQIFRLYSSKTDGTDSGSKEPFDPNVTSKGTGLKKRVPSKYKDKKRTPSTSIKNYQTDINLMQAESPFGLPHLNDQDKINRLSFAIKFLDVIDKDPKMLESVFFSDEGNFWPFKQSTTVITKNGPIVDKVSKKRYFKKKLHHESEPLPTIVWCAMNGKEVIGPYFFNSHVTDRTYSKMLRTYFIPELKKKNYDLNSIWFQQDGAPPHRSKRVLPYLKNQFGDRLISYAGPNLIWPSKSQDLTPLDYFLWDYLKIRLVDYNPTAHYNLRIALEFEMESIDPEILEHITQVEFRKRLLLCIEAKGDRFE